MKQGTALPWSYSKLTAFETCPRRFFLTTISKQVVEAQTAATLHGNEVHKALERYVGGKAALPAKYDAYKPMADKLRLTPGDKKLEYKFGLTSSLQPTTFFGKDVWCRGVIDYGLIRPTEAILIDYKTGKRKHDIDQLRMFALAGFSLWPHVETVHTGYAWLKDGKLDKETFVREDAVEINREFSVRVHRLALAEQNNDWPAKPSGLCGWCPVGREHCENWKGNAGENRR